MTVAPRFFRMLLTHPWPIGKPFIAGGVHTISLSFEAFSQAAVGSLPSATCDAAQRGAEAGQRESAERCTDCGTKGSNRWSHCASKRS
jgi:hypothetical protein